jgi:hypothetical protein
MRLYTGVVIWRLIGCSLILAALLAGCHSGPAAGPEQPSSSANYKVYKLRGKVVSTDAARGEGMWRTRDFPPMRTPHPFTGRRGDS